jgi:hypothetical protein
MAWQQSSAVSVGVWHDTAQGLLGVLSLCMIRHARYRCAVVCRWLLAAAPWHSLASHSAGRALTAALLLCAANSLTFNTHLAFLYLRLLARVAACLSTCLSGWPALR